MEDTDRPPTPPDEEGTHGPGEAADDAGEETFSIDMDALTEADVRELLEKARRSEEYLEKLQYSRAEFQNYRKRMEKERESWRRFGVQDLALELLPVLDTLERAVEAPAATAGKEHESFLEGFRLIGQMFRETLDRFGVRPMEAVDQPFDPCFHDAQGFLDDPGRPPNTVSAEIQKGYMLHDRVLRPAKVLLARGEEPPGETTCDPGTEEADDET